MNFLELPHLNPPSITQISRLASFSPPEGICDGSISNLISNSPAQGALKVSHPSKRSQDNGGTTCSSTQPICHHLGGHLFYPWCSALLGPPSVFSKSSPRVREAWTSPECCVHLFAVMALTAVVCPQRALSPASACLASHLSGWNPGPPRSPHSCHLLGLLIHHPAVPSTQQDLNPRCR